MAEKEIHLDVVEGEAAPEGSRFGKAHHVLLFFLAAGVVVWLLSGFYQVKNDQIAIVERLGSFLTNGDGSIRNIEHGLQYHLPWPIDRVHLISVQQEYTLSVNAFNASPTAYEDFKRTLLRAGNQPAVINALFDPYLITADKSVAHVEISVQFRIKDPGAWLTSVSHEYQTGYDPSSAEDMRNQLFQQLAQRVIISQVSQMTLENVVLSGREEMGRGIAKALQEAMKLPDPADPTHTATIDLGVEVRSVAISAARVPDAVKPAYDDLNSQRAKAQAVILTANADAAGLVARAEGEKSTLISDANAYRQTTVQAAKGDADRFSQVLKQYNNAPDVTRWNLFVDAATSVTGAAKRMVFAQPGQKTVITIDPPQYDAGQVQPGK